MDSVRETMATSEVLAWRIATRPMSRVNCRRSKRFHRGDSGRTSGQQLDPVAPSGIVVNLASNNMQECCKMLDKLTAPCTRSLSNFQLRGPGQAQHQDTPKAAHCCRVATLSTAVGACRRSTPAIDMGANMATKGRRSGWTRQAESRKAWRLSALFALVLTGLTLAVGFGGPAAEASQQHQQAGQAGTSSRQVGARPVAPQQQAAANNGQAREANRLWPKLVAGETSSTPPTTNKLLKRAGSGHFDLEQAARSAEMPAEFRDVEQQQQQAAPKEQSRLAKLCQQTSSVLASVLPAPFGGHKRSILCQFFGQVQVPTSSAKSEDEQTRPRPAAQFPIGGVSPLPAHIQQQLMNSVTANEPESIAILHQQQEAPVALVATGKHPIQMVLEHQQRQAAVLASMLPSMLTPVITNPYQQLQLNYHATDLRTVPSSGNYLEQTQQQQTRKPAKFSSPLVVTSPAQQQHQQRPILVSVGSPAGSSTNSSGWHIINATFLASSSPAKREPDSDYVSTSTMKPAPARKAPQQSPGTSENAPSNSTTKSPPVDPSIAETQQAGHQRPKTVIVGAATAVAGNQTSGIRQLRIGKQAGEASPQQNLNMTSSTTSTTAATSTSTTKRPERVEGRQGGESAAIDGKSEGVRTIDVMAHSASAPSSSYVAMASPNDRSLAQQAVPLTNQTKPGPSPTSSSSDPGQIQKREELVIASINNLTRIAFGNQLRDTMKVINRLIDQQADLFNKPASGSPSQVDPMLISESIGRHTVVVAQQIAGGDKLPAIKTRNKQEQPAAKQSTASRNKAKAAAAEPKTRHKQIGAASSSAAKNTSTTPSDKQRRTRDKKKTKSTASEEPIAAGHADGKPSSTTSQRGLRFSQSIPTSSSSDGAIGRSRHPGSPMVVQNFELKRLTTVSRALTLPGDQRRKPTKGLTRSGQRARPETELDLDGAQSFTSNELARETVGKSSSWFPSTGPMTKASSIGASKLAKSKSRASSTSSTNALTSTTPMLKVASASANVVTQFPWLVPDKSSLNSDLFSTAGSSASESKLTSGAESIDKPLTTRRMVTPYVAGFDLIAKGSASSNRVEHQTRLDSLTTLKMAVSRPQAGSRSTPTVATLTTAAPQQQYVGVRSTRLPFSSGAQSRWIPSTIFVTRPPNKSASTRSISKTTSLHATTSTTTTTTTSTTPAPTSQMLQEQKEKEMALATMNELRASDSISRYTTHLSGEANGLIATTRRHFQHPMPQIANTGDFFSAETIASWPDKYHTMISQAAVDTSAADQETGSKTTASLTGAGGTTRRDGNSYDLTPDSSSTSFASSLPPSSYAKTTTTTTAVQQTTLARHKFDGIHYESTKGPQEVALLLSNTPGITILPANHKLTPAVALGETQELTSSTNSMRGSHEPEQQSLRTTELPTVYAFGSTRQVAPYTLIENQVSHASTLPAGVPSSSPGLDVQREMSAWPKSNSSMPSDSLRPPYLDAYGSQEEPLTEPEIKLSDPTLVLDSSQNRPHVSRKLYELLVPSTQNFVGQQNPLNTQRFNWSALKYLAQNLLAGGRLSNGTADVAAWQQNDTNSENTNRTQQRLYDLITRNGFPSNYYDMFSLTGDNETSTTADPEESSGNGNGTQSKGIFERAGNLLHDLKEMEQKKAAAILAAFRYQVPGPLVRPWDMASDYQSQSPQGQPQQSSISRFLSDRFDLAGNNVFGKERQMLTSQLMGTIKSTLFKQKFIARDELEARLNAGRRSSNDRESSEQEEPFPLYGSNLTDTRRSDSDIELKEVFGKHGAGASSSRQDATEFVLSDGNETALEIHNSSFLAKHPLRKLLLEPLGLVNLTDSSDKTSVQQDFDAINLSEELVQKQIQPIYQSVDPSRVKPKALGEDAISQKSAPSKSSKDAAPVEAPTTSKMKGRTTNRGGDSEVIGTGVGSTDNFDCRGKGAGFYPEARSSCRTFYHCSETGHLLTFECPTQTRFDERSLKCDPWYEVRCDTYRERVG